MEGLTIREAKREEAAMIAALSASTFYEAFAAQNSKANMDHYLSQHFKTHQVEQEFDEPNARIFLALIDNSVAGYAKVSTRYHPKKLEGKRPLEVERLYVKAAYQGRKIGEALMQHAISFARSINRGVVWLGVWEHNTGAIRFYERFGFAKFDEHDFVLGSDVQHDWMMMLNLENA